MTDSGDKALEAAMNTDLEIWREREGDYYADSIRVTASGGIGIDCGGHVFVLPIREWHRLALAASGAVPVVKGMWRTMDDAQIDHMVSRFLNWKLPENFNPDGGISFKSSYGNGTDYGGTHKPAGTNLFTHEQATAMVRYMLENLPPATLRAPSESEAVRALTEALDAAEEALFVIAGGSISEEGEAIEQLELIIQANRECASNAAKDARRARAAIERSKP